MGEREREKPHVLEREEEGWRVMEGEEERWGKGLLLHGMEDLIGDENNGK